MNGGGSSSKANTDNSLGAAIGGLCGVMVVEVVIIIILASWY